MNILEDDFIPEFNLENIYGIVSTNKSKLIQRGIYSFVSIYNSINITNIKTDECIARVGSRNEIISTFAVDDTKIIIGYQTGVIEIIDYDLVNGDTTSLSVIKIHKKQVNAIALNQNGFISVSNDGRILGYDYILANIFIYDDITIGCIGVKINNTQIFVIAKDNTIKIYKIGIKGLKDVLIFDNNVDEVIVRGHEMLAIERGGYTYLIDLRDKSRKRFEIIRMLRSIVEKKDKILIHTNKKIIEYKITKSDGLGLICERRIDSNKRYKQIEYMNNEIIFLTNNNGIEIFGNKNEQIVHKNKIIDLKIEENFVYSISKEKMIKWIVIKGNKFDDLKEDLNIKKDQNVEENNIIKNKIQKEKDFKNNEINEKYIRWEMNIIGWINKENIICFEIFNKFIAIGTNNGLELYNKYNLEYIRTIGSKKINSISGFNDIIAIAQENIVKFYDNFGSEITVLNSHDIIICVKFSKTGKFICTTTYDNKINVYNYPDITLVLSLYGHSLPVRNLDISNDDELIISCSADKTIKLWGLKYGDCKKMFIGNCQNVAFVNKNLFICADKNLMYFSINKKLKEWKANSTGIVCIGTDFFVTSVECGLMLYVCGKYEFIEEDIDESVEYEGLETARKDKYEEFLRFLEKAINGISKEEEERFYIFLESIDTIECVNYFYLLDTQSINIILQIIFNKINRNLILNTRIFISLYKLHKNIIKNHFLYQKLKNILLEKTFELRNLIGTNEARISIDLNYENLDYEI